MQDKPQDEPDVPSPVTPTRIGQRRLYKTNKSTTAVATAAATPQRLQPSRRRRRPGSKQAKARPASAGPKTAYFVYLLVGAHHSYAAAKAAHAALLFADCVPVRYERNENGAGKCRTWLAVTRPFSSRYGAEIVQRQLAIYVGENAVTIDRGEIK